jgi:hypothetical protein
MRILSYSYECHEWSEQGFPHPRCAEVGGQCRYVRAHWLTNLPMRTLAEQLNRSAMFKLTYFCKANVMRDGSSPRGFPAANVDTRWKQGQYAQIQRRFQQFHASKIISKATARLGVSLDGMHLQVQPYSVGTSTLQVIQPSDVDEVMDWYIARGSWTLACLRGQVLTL